MNTADTIMVGPLGARALAAAGVASAVHIFGVIVGSGLLVGLSPLVSQSFGAGRPDECRRVLHQGLWLAAAASIPVVVLSLAGEPVLRLLGQEDAIARLGGAYLRALAWGVPPFFVFVAFRQYLEGMGEARPTMVFTFLGLSVNVLGNRLLIYGVPGRIPALGVPGSGWSTTIVRWTMLAAVLLFVLLDPRTHPFGHGSGRPDIRRLGRIVHVGAPIAGQMGLEVGLFSFAAVMMGWLGPVPLAAHQVTLNIASTTFMVALGISIAGSVRVGQHIGASRPADLRRAVAATYVLAVGCMATFAILFLAAGSALIRLYTPDAAIIALGTRLLLVAAAFQVFDGGQVAGISILRGAADTRGPMIIAGLGYWGVGVPTAYLAFAMGAGPLGIWAGLCLGLAVVAVLLGLRVRSMAALHA
jgi:MATE family, multidrug efflux pump